MGELQPRKASVHCHGNFDLPCLGEGVLAHSLTQRLRFRSALRSELRRMPGLQQARFPYGVGWAKVGSGQQTEETTHPTIRAKKIAEVLASCRSVATANGSDAGSIYPTIWRSVWQMGTKTQSCQMAMGQLSKFAESRGLPQPTSGEMRVLQNCRTTGPEGVRFLLSQHAAALKQFPLGQLGKYFKCTSQRGKSEWCAACTYLMKNMLASPGCGVVSQLVLPMLEAWIGSESRTTHDTS